jgi:hypothetical protein
MIRSRRRKPPRLPAQSRIIRTAYPPRRAMTTNMAGPRTEQRTDFALGAGAALALGFAIEKLLPAASPWASRALYIAAYALGGYFTLREAIDNLRHRTATVRRNGEISDVAVEDLSIGDIVVVRPNERLASKPAQTLRKTCSHAAERRPDAITSPACRRLWTVCSDPFGVLGRLDEMLLDRAGLIQSSSVPFVVFTLRLGLGHIGGKRPAWVRTSRSPSRRKSSSFVIQFPIVIGLRARACSSANSK